MKKLAIFFYLTNNVNNKPWPEIKYQNKDMDYYMFTDDHNHKPDSRWNVVYIKSEDDMYTKEDMNKNVKWHPFKYFEGKYEYALYCDSKFEFVGDPMKCLNEYKDKLKYGFTGHRYGYIKNEKYVDNIKDVYKHADYLIDVKVGHVDNIKRLKEAYQSEGLPADTGVMESGVILTDLKSDIAKKVENDIFNEYIKRNTKRDQLVIPYILWKYGIDIKDVELFGCFNNNPHVKYFKVNNKTNVNNRKYDSIKYHDAPKVVISMTSWVKRINNVKNIVESIMNNTIKPDIVYLNLSKIEFDNIELPTDLIDYFNSDNRLVINWVDGPNTKSVKKIFPILKYLNDDDIIINVDDDIIIPDKFIESRLNDYKKFKNPITGGTSINCKGAAFHDVCKLDYMKTATACSLYTKRMLNGYQHLLTNNIIQYYNDDIMYSALVYLNGYKFYPCSDYSVWSDKSWAKHKLSFFNQEDALSKQTSTGNYKVNSQDVVKEILKTVASITSKHPFNKLRYSSFTKHYTSVQTKTAQHVDEVGKVCIVAIAKLENHYINEWINHHLNIGIDHIYLYDNNDTDGERLSSVVHNDKVTIIDAIGKKYYQKSAYTEAYHKHQHEYNWFLFIDIDEFVMLSKKYKTIKSFISFINKKAKNPKIIRLCWKNYGDSNKLDVVNGKYNVVKRFLLPSANRRYDKTCKLLLNSKVDVDEFRSVHSVHINKAKNLDYSKSAINALGVKCSNTNTRIASSVHTNCWINHYRTKTVGEFIRQKYVRGNANNPSEQNAYISIDLPMFWELNTRTPQKEAYAKKLIAQLSK